MIKIPVFSGEMQYGVVATTNKVEDPVLIHECFGDADFPYEVLKIRLSTLAG